jgi:hypothetical protein
MGLMPSVRRYCAARARACHRPCCSKHKQDVHMHEDDSALMLAMHAAGAMLRGMRKQLEDQNVPLHKKYQRH